MKILPLTFFIIMTAMVLRAGQSDPQMTERILSAIAKIESGNRNLGIHSDGVSYGKYGVTMIAVRELQRNHILAAHISEKDLLIPMTNELAAREYLKLMYKKYKCWYKAAGAYHSQQPEKRDAYAKKVFDIITNEEL